MKYEERLKQRKEQLELAIYFAKEFISELGKEKALETIEKAWTKYQIDNWNKRLGDVSPDAKLEALGEWFKQEAANRPELKVLEATPKRVCIEISRCVTYDVCSNLGVPEICQRYCDSDYPVAQAIHPKITLVRDKEIAYNAAYCNHCWVMGE